jgi:hypothetical protein
MGFVVDNLYLIDQKRKLIIKFGTIIKY